MKVWNENHINLNLEEILSKKIKLLFYKYFDSFDFCYMLFHFFSLLYSYFVRFLLFLLYYNTVKNSGALV